MATPRSTLEFVELIGGRSRAVAYDLVGPVARLLTVAREACDGDLDKALLMMVITLCSSGHPDFKDIDFRDLAPDTGLPGAGTNVRSLAESTGIPKETVRRKVRDLIEAGWVVRNGQTLRYSLQGYHAVQPVRDAIIRMYARGIQVVGALD